MMLAPGPKPRPVIGSLPEMRRDALRFLLTAHRQHGDVVTLQIGPRRVFLVAHPDGVKHIFQDNHKNYHKSSRYALTKTLLGDGLLTSNGEHWLQQRRLIQPIFHKRRIESFAEVMVQATHAQLETRWASHAASGRPLDVLAEMMRLTLTIIGFTLFSADVRGDAEDVGEALSVALHHTSRRLDAVLTLPERLPTPGHVRFAAAMRVLDRVVYGMIRARRRSGETAGDKVEAKDDLLAMLLAAQDADTGERMSDKQVRDEAMTLFLAGHETTANALGWTFYLLALHPEITRKLHHEVDTVLAGRAPTVSDLPALPYSKQVLEEALRLYPPAWAVGRHALGDDTIGGYTIPAGHNVIVSMYVTHRHPDFWAEPERFDPERFEGARRERRHRFAYVPFAAGPRQCIGNHFALMEAQLLLATISQRYALALLPGHPIETEPTLTLRPKHGLMMTLTARP